MAFVRVEQRSAHLAGPVLLDFVNGREGRIARGRVTAISNTWRGSGAGRQVQATAIQWTLWGRLAENAAEYLGKGSHVNIVGRLENNNYEKDGEAVYSLDFTCEELDYLDSKAEADARRTTGHTAESNGTARRDKAHRQARRQPGRTTSEPANA